MPGRQFIRTVARDFQVSASKKMLIGSTASIVGGASEFRVFAYFMQI